MEKSVFYANKSGAKVENAIAKFDWNHPNKPYNFFTGNNVRIKYQEDTIQIIATYVENSFWVVVNIPNTYADGQYQIITSQEADDGLVGIVLGHVMGQELFTTDHSGSMSLKRNGDKFTITFSALHLEGYNLLNGFIEFEDKPLS